MQIQGLTSAQAEELYKNGQNNKLSSSKTKTVREIFIENIFSVFNYVIAGLIAALLYFYFRTDEYKIIEDAIGLISIAILNTSIAIVQEIKAKRALDKVNLLLVKEVTVIRDGAERSVEHEKIVKGDVIHIKRGDQAVVDGKLIKCTQLEIDESLLTGESLPVRKDTDDTILSGSFCVSGNGYYTADNIGDDSYAAHITDLAKKYKFVVTPLQKRLNVIVKVLFVTAVFLVLLQIFTDPGASPDNASFIRKCAAILFPLIPQGLVLMSSVTFALGVYRISKLGAIIQKLNAIESFANVQIVCMDKTGTLTKNILAVEQLNILNKELPEEEIRKLLCFYAQNTSDKNATIRALDCYKNEEAISAKTLSEIPFTSELKRSFLQIEISSGVKTLALGGWDVLLPQCSPEDRQSILDIYENKTLRVYRNLLFGEAVSNKDLSDNEYSDSVSIKPLAMISISDQARDDVMDAIELFMNNGINFKILSGDTAYAVQAIAEKIGWEIDDTKLITGDELENLSEEEYTRLLHDKLIFARLKPEHKLKLIKALKKEKIYTAMIGDGVNDLPAIKEAHLGIAMEEGSAITKEISDIVLLKNKFSLLPAIFNEGNKIINTVSSVAKLFLTKTFIVIYFTLISLLFAVEFPLTVPRVALINIFTIALPSFIIALKNTNTDTPKKFMAELFSFVMLSALIIVISSYAAMLIAPIAGIIDSNTLKMFMLTVVICASTANFLAVAIRKGNENNRFYALYAVFIIVLFILIERFDSEFIIIKFLRNFYEIRMLTLEQWLYAGIISIISAAILLLLQKAREKFIIKHV